MLVDRSNIQKEGALGHLEIEKGPDVKMKFDSQKNNLIVVITLILFCFYGFFTLEFYPGFGLDEAAYIDPAINYVLGRGFVSDLWYSQDGSMFWAGNVPLSEFAAIPWLKSFGTSLTSVRAFALFLTVLGGLFFWMGIGYSGLIKRHSLRLFWFFLYFFSVDVRFCTQGGVGRPEPMCFFVAGLLFFLYFKLDSINRKWLLFVGASVSIWMSLPLGLFGAVLVLLLCFLGFIPLTEVVFAGLGFLVGNGTLILLYTSQGVLPQFLRAISPHIGSHEHLNNYKGWISYLFVWSWITVLLTLKAVHPIKKTLFFFAGISILVLAIFNGFFKYPTHYRWMLGGTLSIVAVFLLDNAFNNKRYWNALLVFCFISLLSIGVFSGHRVLTMVRQYNELKYSIFRDWALKYVNEKDEVLTSPALYYALKPKVAKFYLPFSFEVKQDGFRADVLFLDEKMHFEMPKSILRGYCKVGILETYHITAFRRKEQFMGSGPCYPVSGVEPEDTEPIKSPEKFNPGVDFNYF